MKRFERIIGYHVWIAVLVGLLTFGQVLASEGELSQGTHAENLRKEQQSDFKKTVLGLWKKIENTLGNSIARRLKPRPSKESIDLDTRSVRRPKPRPRREHPILPESRFVGGAAGHSGKL